MSIGVQSPTTALMALENLAGIGAGADPNAGVEGALGLLPDPASSPPQPASILDLSLGAATAAADPTDGVQAAADLADRTASAGGAILGLLGRMRDAAAAASDASLDPSARQSLDAGYQSDLARIASVIGQAGLGGVNLIDGSLAGDVPGPGDAGGVSLPASDLTATGSLIGLPAQSNLLDPAGAQAIADTLEAAIGAVGAAVDGISSQADALQGQLDLAAASASGAGAALDQDGARLQALQVQQQLAAGGYALAGPTPAAILALFR
ncbi:MAG: hypothetical protein JO127_07985 [Caulobacteraceae bacterium]|nr:hypothetical protein [Caulobacteraceae bacterium]